MGPILGRALVVFTCLLIAFISYSSQIFVFWPWFGRALSLRFLAILLPFNALIGILWWTYILTVQTSPGRVPPEWQPDTTSGATFEVRRGDGRLRFCRSCNRYKPPRAHHCRECRSCTLRMDHHCPWMNNCIGHFNYAYFIRFLFFVDVACGYHLAVLTWLVWDGVYHRPYTFQPSTQEVVFAILNYAACIPVFCMVGLFSLYHFYLISTNTTTIEGWEKDKVAMLVRRGKIEKVKFPYNLGMLKNIRYVLGKRALTWCWPTTAVQGDGLSYPVAEGTDVLEQYIWPPRDPATNYDPRPLPDTPWTYGNSVNPHLQPSNAARLRARAHKSAVPPYHADYDGPSGSRTPSTPSSESEPESEVDDYDRATGRPRMRRGSEGWEVRPLTAEAREEIVRRYVARHAYEEAAPPPYLDGVVADPEFDLANGDADADHEGRPEDEELVPIPGDKYRRYVPSAEDHSSDEGLEPGYRESVWESHIDPWEDREPVDPSLDIDPPIKEQTL